MTLAAHTEEDPPAEAAVAIGTVHRPNGLEAVIGCEADMLALSRVARALEDVPAQSEFTERERQLFYMACYCARERLLIAYAGAPSPILSPAYQREEKRNA